MVNFSTAAQSIVWHNGQFISDPLTTSPLAYGLHYGYGVFEGIRFYQGKIFKLKEHIARLYASAETIRLKIPYSSDEIIIICEELIKKQLFTDGYLRPLVWEGVEKMAMGSEGSTQMLIAAFDRPIAYESDVNKKKPWRLVSSNWRKASPDTLPSQAKTSGLYLLNSLYKKEADKLGYDDCLLLDYRGYVAEVSTANIFFVFNGELHTPIADCFLNGITRQTVIELAKKRNIKVVERHILPAEIAQASAIFLTGTSMEITPVTIIDNYQFKLDEITQILALDYYNLAHQQIL